MRALRTEQSDPKEAGTWTLRERLTFANVVSVAALLFALGLGSAWAATELGKNSVKSKQIAPGQVKNSDLGDDSVTSPKVADGSLLDDDFAAGQLPAGPQGERGPVGLAGRDGAPGANGADGADGSPDTSQQVLDKLKQVDGGGSGLDADLLDGQGASDFTPTNEVHSTGRVAVNDPTPGDPALAEQELVSNGTLSLFGLCGDNLAPVGGDVAQVRLLNDAGGWSEATSDNGATYSRSANILVPTGQPFASVTDSSTSPLSVGSFFAVSPTGEALSGDVSVELNDTAGAGADCVFAATAIGQQP